MTDQVNQLNDMLSRFPGNLTAHVATAGIVITQTFTRMQDNGRNYELVCIGPETARDLAARLPALADQWERNDKNPRTEAARVDIVRAFEAKMVANELRATASRMMALAATLDPPEPAA